MNTKRIFYIMWCLAFAVFLSGCAATGVRPAQRPLLFYPAEPEEPRIQYLRSFSSSSDVEASQNAFSKFIVGGKTDIKPIVKPYGITIHDGRIYVCDTVFNGLEILDLNNKSFNYFRPAGSGALRDPINLSISDDGKLFVADARRGQVVIFDSSGKYASSVGKKGEFKPTDVAIWKDRLFVCDLKTHSVRVYNLTNNEFLYSIPKEGQAREVGLFSPTNLDIDAEGNVYVSDTGSFSVKKYTSEGVFIKAFGSHGDALGQLARPKGVAVDAEGRIYVVDAAFENVQIFNPEGELLLYFPEAEDAARLSLPAGIHIDYKNIDHFSEFIDEDFDVEYLIFVASQYGPRKINVFGFGKRK